MNFKIGDIINDKYKIIDEIGTGASAKVYLAIDLKKDLHLALKIQNSLDEFSNMEKRFKIEAKTMLSLNHPNIVQTYDYFEWNDRRIMVMEYVRGKTIDQIIREKGPISSENVAEYGLQILSALSLIHDKGIIHRDLKPANIIINLENKVKIMDFGIAQVSMNQELTRQASVIGTIQYLAPEIFKNQKATPTSEMFSFGILLYKMSTGVVPFRGVSPEETARLIISKEPLPPKRVNPDVDEELNNIIMRLLQKDPYNRYKDANATRKAIAKYLNKDINIDDNKKKNSASKEKKSKNSGKRLKFKWIFK